MIGAGTRAAHDLQLLTGGATEQAGPLTVTFCVPPPDPSHRPHVIDLPPTTPVASPYASDQEDPPGHDRA